MRKLHRWVGLVAVLLLLVVAGTGALLTSQRLGLFGRSRPPEQPAGAPTAPPDFTQWVATTVAAAKARAPNATIVSIQLDVQGEAPRGTVRLRGGAVKQLLIDARTGAVLPPPEGEHDPLLLRIHNGDVLGPWGRWVSLLAGLGLLVLALTGLVVYVEMFRARLRGGRRALFW